MCLGENKLILLCSIIFSLEVLLQVVLFQHYLPTDLFERGKERLLVQCGMESSGGDIVDILPLYFFPPCSPMVRIYYSHS